MTEINFIQNDAYLSKSKLVWAVLRKKALYVRFEKKYSGFFY